ncbi:hypothetical protein ASF48_07915 [Rathayibacter sp. Leaf299]|uniref:DUF2283 domain-containing protein n=1 Tax=unclassified Rathayibacter TaxID=2609250 RepID=UPI0006F5FC5E|nr:MULTISPECIES: DUF2283 domain-containing protein [unclassified Rathayibacter]KQQ20550.1 hypothetical protein ASF48_07915 [Rathayibacter sp. Leaf299]
MRVTYDPTANAAYIMVADRIADGSAAQQLPSIATPGGLGEVILDFDEGGRLLGMEILNAREVLPGSVIDAALQDLTD